MSKETAWRFPPARSGPAAVRTQGHEDPLNSKSGAIHAGQGSRFIFRSRAW